MHSLNELVFASQQADLKKEEERLAREKAERAVWLLKAKTPGTYNASQLLEKMVGSGVEGATVVAVPEPVKKPEEKKHVDARFPPPPTSK